MNSEIRYNLLKAKNSTSISEWCQQRLCISDPIQQDRVCYYTRNTQNTIPNCVFLFLLKTIDRMDMTDLYYTCIFKIKSHYIIRTLILVFHSRILAKPDYSIIPPIQQVILQNEVALFFVFCVYETPVTFFCTKSYLHYSLRQCNIYCRILFTDTRIEQNDAKR